MIRFLLIMLLFPALFSLILVGIAAEIIRGFFLVGMELGVELGEFIAGKK